MIPNPFAFINRNVPDIPDHDGVKPFSAISHGDDSKVEGWTWEPYGEPKGTIFFLHGFTDHCRNPLSWRHWIKLAAQFDLALVAFDFRGHGRSSDQWTTFGAGEAWDLLGAMDKAEELGFPLPFILVGESMGALAAQRAAVVDGRIKGCFLAESPKCPHDAIGVATKVFGPLGSAEINLRYGWDVLTDGDVRSHLKTIEEQSPTHRPLLYFIMGTEDDYDFRKAKTIYQEWYRGIPTAAGSHLFPHEEPDAMKWFTVVDGAHHSSIRDQCSVYDWPHFGECQQSFVRRCLA